MQTTQLDTYSHNKQFGSFFKKTIWYFVNCIFFKNAFNISSGLKVALLRAFGAKIGQGVVLKPAINVKYPWLLEIGNHVWIGENVWIDNLDRVTIGDHVCISQGAMLLCGNHNFKKPTFDLITKPITLEDGCWIGAQTVVCLGVIVKSHAVLSVGSIASRDLEAYGIYRGNPSVKVAERVIS